MLKTGERAHRASQGEVGKEGYKFTRENSKTGKNSTDYSYRQQSRPLITRQEFDFRLVEGGSESQHGTGPRVVSQPPPYCPKKWNGLDGGGSGVMQASRIHDYESPKVLRCPRDLRDSLPSPAPGDPPVYFELDPEGNQIISSPGSAGVGTHGSMVALGPDDDIQELR